MSLSLIIKSVFFMVLAFASAFVGREYAAPLAAYFSDVQEITARDARISKRFIVYRLPEEQAVTFTFTQSVTKAKVLVHPSVSEEFRAHGPGFTYGLRLRWRDIEGNELSSYDVYLQADSPDTVFSSGAIWRFFRTRPEYIAEQDQLLVESPAPAALLEVEAFDVDDGVVGIDVRVFEQRAYSDEESLKVYRGLSDQTKQRLTKANAFPADVLSASEKARIARTHWRATGPLGLDGRDYNMLVLYEAVRENLGEGDAEAMEALR